MRIIIIFILFVLTIGCSNNKVVKNHGLNALDIKAEKILVSKSNKNDVLNILGKPSLISLFDNNSWIMAVSFFSCLASTSQNIYSIFCIHTWTIRSMV